MRTKQAVTDDAYARLQRSVFVLGDGSRMAEEGADSEFVCCGFFFGRPGRAATANHCLSTDVQVRGVWVGLGLTHKLQQLHAKHPKAGY